MAQIYKSQPRRVQAKPVKNQLVVGLNHQGKGVVRDNKGVRFIAGALADETISFMPRGKYEGDLIAIEAASSQREQPACGYYDECGGCDLQHLELNAQRQHKQRVVQELMQKFSGLEAQQWLAPLTGDAWHYRRRARLAVHYDRKRKQLKVGFRAAKSKQIVSIHSCLTLAQSIERLLPTLPSLLQGLQLARELGHVELIELDPRPVVLLRVESAPCAQDTALLQSYAETHQVAIWIETASGSKALTHTDDAYSYATAGANLVCQPSDFLQTHRQLGALMVAVAQDWLAPCATDHILELYAGSGHFSIPLALSGARVTAVEGVQSMVEQLQRNAATHGVEVSSYCTDLEQPWPQSSWAQPGFNKVLLDPARAGAPHAIKEVAKRLPEKIVYVSCAPDTLARDAAVLKAAGYQLKRAQIIDMFPQTHHIEVMTEFEQE